MESGNEAVAAELQEALKHIEDILEEARQRQIPECTSVSLATADAQGQPSVRTVYLSSIAPRGPVFFLNLLSGKGKQLSANPRAGICLFIPELQQQATLEGTTEFLSSELADEIWQHRSHESRLASWASDQGSRKEDQYVLEAQKQEIKSRYDFEPIPRPANWTGVILLPTRIEFWETGWNRMRQRKLYTRNDNGVWQIEAENP